jgi:WXG100 family type VII secretion target
MANINVSYDQMEDAAGRLRMGKEDLGAKLGELQTMITNLVSSGFVTDSSSQAFEETTHKFITGTKTALEALDSLAYFLSSAASAMRETDAGLAGKIRTNG